MYHSMKMELESLCTYRLVIAKRRPYFAEVESPTLVAPFREYL